MPPYNFFDPFYASFHVPMLFVLGCLLGSFFNVCIYRIPLGISIATPPSHCYRCGRQVKWYDNVPLLSYWILRGRCRHCGAPFSMRYFWIEFLTGCLFLIAGLRLGYTLALVPAFIFTGLLIIATFTDIDHWIIPDRISLGGMAMGLALAAVWPLSLAKGNPLASDPLMELFLRPSMPALAIPLATSVAGAIAGYGLLWIVGIIGSAIFRKEAMGMGDMKLMAMFGAFCGVERLVYILMLSSFIGTGVGVAMILRSKLSKARPVDPAAEAWAGGKEAARALLAEKPLGELEWRAATEAFEHPGVIGKARHHLPFGPSLAIAAYISYLYGEPIGKWLEQLTVK